MNTNNSIPFLLLIVAVAALLLLVASGMTVQVLP